MKVNVESTSMRMDSEKMSVNKHWTGEISVAFGDKAFFFSPKNAVTLWRMLVGEKNFDKIPYKKYELMETSKEVFVWYEGDTEEWRLRFADDYCVVLDADEALALSWAIKVGVARDIYGSEPRAVQAAEPKEVWVLSCRRLIVDRDAVKDSDRLGGYEEVFLSKEKACDAVREFMRPLVNEAYPESFWTNGLTGKTVDDILDEIFEEHPAEGSFTDFTYWTHDGMAESFEVKICKRELK